MIDGDGVTEGKARPETGVKEVVTGVDEVKVSVNEESLATVVGDKVDIALLVSSLVVGPLVTLAILETAAEVESGWFQAVELCPNSEPELVRIDWAASCDGSEPSRVKATPCRRLCGYACV